MTSMTQAARLTAIATANIGTIAHLDSDVHGQRRMKIVSLGDKTGKLKDGSEAHFIVLQQVDAPEGTEPMVLKLHPGTAETLFRTLKAAQLSLEEGVITPEEVAANDALIAEQAELEKAEKVAARTAKEAAKKAEKAAVSAAKKAEKGPTKADQARDIYTRMVAANKERKDIIATFKVELGMGDSGAATYYQNCKKAAEEAAKQ